MRWIAALVLLLVVGAAPAERPNVLLIMADDFGVDLLGSYREILLQERALISPDCANDPNCAPDPPCTPNIDALAARGVRFTRAWSSPLCSPTRAQILTGLHAHRNGIGRIVDEGVGIRFATKPLAIAAREAGYATAAVGKWHLTSDVDEAFSFTVPTDAELVSNPSGSGCSNPYYNGAGFDYYAGSMFNLDRTFLLSDPERGYRQWEKNFNGIGVTEYCVYATSDTVDDALTLLDPLVPLPCVDATWRPCRRAVNQQLPTCADFDLQEKGRPWFLYVPLNAPHLPEHDPSRRDETLCPPLGDPELTGCYRCDDGDESVYANVRTIVEAMDVELGRLLSAVDLDNTVVIFLGDNGTIQEATSPLRTARDSLLQCQSGKAKGTLYEGGIRVPLIVAGPGIPAGALRHGLVSTVDLYATICELIGSPERPRDSVSFAPQLYDESVIGRRTVYAERFATNFHPICTNWRAQGIERKHNRTIRDDRFKLIRTRWRGGGCRRNALELYDMHTDPFEEHNLLAAPEDRSDPQVMLPATYADYCALRCELVEMGVDVPAIDDVCGLCNVCLDPDRDGDFDSFDLQLMLIEFGSRDGDYGSDLDRNGRVDMSDLARFLSRYGTDCD